jgi:hypothetical protein
MNDRLNGFMEDMAIPDIGQTQPRCICEPGLAIEATRCDFEDLECTIAFILFEFDTHIPDEREPLAYLNGQINHLRFAHLLHEG